MVVVVMAQGLQIVYIWSKFAERGLYFLRSVRLSHFMSIISSFFDIYVLNSQFQCSLLAWATKQFWLGASLTLDIAQGPHHKLHSIGPPKSLRRPCWGLHSIGKSHSILGIYFCGPINYWGSMLLWGPYFLDLFLCKSLFYCRGPHTFLSVESI